MLGHEQLWPEKGIKYSRTHLGRLEDAGRFPKRRQLGAGRIGWLEHEIDEWLANRPAGKLPPNGAPASTCTACGKRFERKPGPGRPYERCPDCRCPRQYLPWGTRVTDIEAIPPGKILVHNHVHPAERQGTRGFRFWLADAPPAENYEPCDCAWAPRLPVHYRVRRGGS
jgi:prophage regulatory protein